MKIDNTKTGLSAQITREIKDYTTQLVNVNEAYDYSQFKLVRRITLFEGRTYPTGKFDSQGNYKLWYDGISSRISNEVKNIDFDTKDVKIYSDRSPIDDLPVLIVNLKLKEYLRDNEIDEEFNSAIEEGSGWGNIVWKKVGKEFERVDLKNFYVVNQTAKCLEETPVIERHQFSSSDLRAKIGVWENVKEVLEQNKSNRFKSQIQSQAKDTTVPYYDIYERNGEVCLKDLKELQGEIPSEGDEDVYVFAKVIGAAQNNTTTLTPSINYILFAEEMKGCNEDIYKEFHRGVYKGKWFREGLYELLFDQQVRLNQIGNQIAQGLELASKTILRSKDKLIVQNILTDMRNGDIIKTEDLQAVPIEMRGFTELANDWNTVQQMMNDIANSSPIVTGEGMPQRMPFQVAALLNQNANKLFDYIRQKLAIPFTDIFESWVIPEFVKELSGQEILRLTGDSKMFDRLCEMIVDDWYVSNMIAIGPHGRDVADFLKSQQMEELKKRPQIMMKGLQAVFKDFHPSVSCVITGENSTLPQDMQTLSTFIALEQDPIRRTALIEMAMQKKGIDTASLPKSPPQQMIPSPIQQKDLQAVSGATNLPARPNPPVRGGVAPAGSTQH
jgi:hypothetical protein